jgi:hypothetical protein
MSADQKSPPKPVPAPAGGSPKAVDTAPAAAKGSATAHRKGPSKAKRAKGGQAKSGGAAKGKGGRSRAGGERRKSGTERLRPGGLDRIVMADLKKREAEWPLTASAVGKSVGRSSGAIANCLARLEAAKQVRLAKPKPRSYDLKGL